MAQKKKLQVFVSSTYTDLQGERQAAVEAILAARHIPAGMELFAAGNESQMNVIKRWIDESDVFMLILGGRYGSIEPKSQKSYIHLEYEYATEKNKPVFAVVIDKEFLAEKVKKSKKSNILSTLEQEHPDKLNQFRDLVCSNKLVKFCRDPKDIKLAIMETMSEMSERPDLTGWIPGSEAIDSSRIAEELTKLWDENSRLREQLEIARSISATEPTTTVDIFLQYLYKTYIRIGEDSYVSLDVLKRSLSGIYPDDQFDNLLKEARQAHSDKIWIDREVDKTDKDNPKHTTIIKIKEL